MAAPRANVRACHCNRQKQRRIVLDAQPFESVVAVGEPDTLCALHNAEIDAAPARSAAFNFHMREVGAQTVDQGVGAACLIRVGHRQHAVVVPFDVVDRMRGKDRGHAVVDEFADLGQTHVEGLLLTTKRLILATQRPIGVGAVDVAVGVDHLGLEPDSEGHAEVVDVVDQGTEAVGIFARIDLPIGQAARVIIALAEPTVVEHKAFSAQIGGAGGDVFEHVEFVVEVDRFPAIVVHRAEAVVVGPRHDAVAQVALKGHRATIEAGLGIGDVEGGGLERCCGLRFHPGGVAKLDLAAAIGEFFGDHLVPAGPAIVKPVGLPLGVGATGTWDQKTGEMFMACAARAVLAVAHTGRPRGAVGLKLAGPAACKVDHLFALLRRRQNGCRKPVQMHGAVGL